MDVYRSAPIGQTGPTEWNLLMHSLCPTPPTLNPTPFRDILPDCHPPSEIQRQHGRIQHGKKTGRADRVTGAGGQRREARSSRTSAEAASRHHPTTPHYLIPKDTYHYSTAMAKGEQAAVSYVSPRARFGLIVFVYPYPTPPPFFFYFKKNYPFSPAKLTAPSLTGPAPTPSWRPSSAGCACRACPGTVGASPSPTRR